MIVVHHLNNSRSQRILWLLEELGAPYEIVRYQRDATTNLAPPELKNVHPLGKSPVIEDGPLILAESGAIVDYLIRKHGGGKFAPPEGTDAHELYNEWLHYAEGSAMLPLMLQMYLMRLGEAGAPLKPRVDSENDNHLGYIDRALEGAALHHGRRFHRRRCPAQLRRRGGQAFGRAATHRNLGAWVERLHARDAFKRALEKGGAYNLA